MATITGQSALNPIVGMWGLIIHHYLLQGSPGGAGLPPTGLPGSGFIVRVPTTITPINKTATAIWDFTQVYYNRIAVLPEFLDVGSVSSAQTFQVEVWNAFFENRVLTTIDEIDADGIVLSNGIPIGGTYNLLQSSIYDITVEADGPPTINAFLMWYLNGDSGTLNIVGSRLSVFGFEPDTMLGESLQWLTDVIQTYSGEQRIRLRNNARQVFEFTTQADNSIQTRLNNIMYGWQDKVFALPEWVDAVNHPTEINATASVIYIPTDYLDFRDGGLAIIWASDLKNEAVEIDTVESDRLNLLREVVNDYPDGALVIPLIRCRAQGGLRKQIGRMDDTRSTITFRGLDNINMDSQAFDWITYLGYEVLTDPNAQFGSIESTILLPQKFIDNKTGAFRAYLGRDFAQETVGQGWIVRGAQDRYSLKRFLYRRLGRLKPFWIDTYRKDYVPVETIGAAAIAINVKAANQKFLDIADTVFGLHMVLKDGTEWYKTLTGLQSEDLVNETEVIEIDSNFGQDITPEEVDRFSLMRLSRFDTDNLPMEHYIGDGIFTKLVVPVVSIKYPEIS